MSFNIDDIGSPLTTLSKLGLSHVVLTKIGGLAVFAANIEFCIEQVIWELQGGTIPNTYPSTDGKNITQLINDLLDISVKISDDELTALINLWSEAARPLFRCRNTIFHGSCSSLDGESAFFGKGFRWDGIQRKRDFSSFHADEHTIELIFSAFFAEYEAIKLIFALVRGQDHLVRVPQTVASLHWAKSIASELDDLTSALNSEKY